MSIKPHQVQSPLKKLQTKSSQIDFEDQTGKKSAYNISKSPFMTEGQKINFQSQDSQGSDISYESSIESEEDINIGQIEYFKEEMGRFFVNYPELVNHDILGEREQDFEREHNFIQDVGNSHKPDKLNKNWYLISDQILNQAKDSSSFLQSLSHRIALYRSKIHQQDLIDVILKQQKNILEQIELQINIKKKQIKGPKNTMMELTKGTEDVYFSWRKKKEIENKLNLHRDQSQDEVTNVLRSSSLHIKASPNAKNQQKSAFSTFRDRTNTISNKKLISVNTKSLTKRILDVGKTKSGNLFLTTRDTPTNQSNQQNKITKPNSKQQKPDKKFTTATPSALAGRPIFQTKNIRQFCQNDRQKTIIQQTQKQNKCTPSTTNQSQTFWKHLVNFEPRTEAGRQLCELIRRTNNPNDQLGIKKTIMQFLSRNKETVQNEIVLKSTISQKIQKLYNDDSKQLLMFYPTKMTTGQPPNHNRQDLSHNKDWQSEFIGGKININDYQSTGENAKGPLHQGQSSINRMDLGNRLFEQGEKFMHLLEDIVEGPLMKYWMILQENKL